MPRSLFATALTASLVMASSVWGQASPLASADGGPMAILIRNPDPDPGAPPFALADQYGRVQRFVEASPRVDLKSHLGEKVRIKHDSGQTLLASQLELPRLGVTFDSAAPRNTAPAQFIPPQIATRIDDGFVVRTAQAESSIMESADPGPARSTAPIMLDELPIPSGAEVISTPPASQIIQGTITTPTATLTAAAPCPDCGPHAPAQGANCSTCGRSGGLPMPTCCPPSKRGLYGRADYLLWRVDGFDTPALATDNPDGDPPVITDSDTRVIYGGELLEDARNGLRLTLGGWLDCERNFAIEGDWLIVEDQSGAFTASDPFGTTAIGRPFYNVAPTDPDTLISTTPDEDAYTISEPGVIGGTLAINSRSEFESFGLRARTGIACRTVGGGGPGCDCSTCQSGRGFLRKQINSTAAISRVDFLAGYRYAVLNESLGFDQTTAPVTDDLPQGTTTINERFSVDNDFHGLDLGVVYDWRSCRWGLELTGKVAVGGTSQTVRIQGTTTDIEGETTDGGLLAQSTNIGAYKQDRFSVLPELSARLSYKVAPNLSLSAAYTMLYWANVVRPGDQIDYSVDGRFLVDGAAIAPTANTHPRVDLEESSFWAHGLNFGLDYNY